MANIIMFWDRINVLGDPLAGIEVLSNQAIAVPAKRAGFGSACPISTGTTRGTSRARDSRDCPSPATASRTRRRSPACRPPTPSSREARCTAVRAAHTSSRRRWRPSASERRHPTEAVGGRWRAFTVLMSFRISAGQAAHFGSSPDALWMFVRVTIRQPKPTPSIWPRSWLRSRSTGIS